MIQSVICDGAQVIDGYRNAGEKSRKPRPPKTDSIKKLAEFRDRHDLTDFEDELEEVVEPVLVRPTAIKVPPRSARSRSGRTD